MASTAVFFDEIADMAENSAPTGERKQWMILSGLAFSI